MHICTVIKEKVQSLQTEQNKFVFKQDLNDDGDGTHMTSFGIELQTEAKKRASPSVALLCTGQIKRGMACELERVLPKCDGSSCSMSVIYDDVVLL